MSNDPVSYGHVPLSPRTVRTNRLMMLIFMKVIHLLQYNKTSRLALLRTYFDYVEAMKKFRDVLSSLSFYLSLSSLLCYNCEGEERKEGIL